MIKKTIHFISLMGYVWMIGLFVGCQSFNRNEPEQKPALPVATNRMLNPIVPPGMFIAILR